VHAKLSDARISVTPKKFKKYLILIKEVLADEYSIEPIPTAAEIRATNAIPKPKKIFLESDISPEVETTNSKQDETSTQQNHEPKKQLLNIDIETPFDS
jgi:hypothetical protein